MKKGNRLLSILLCLAMLMSMFSTFAFAETAKSGGINALADIPTGDVNSLTGAKPTTNVALTVSADAYVVDGTVSDATTDYVLNWNGTDYPDMFTYGTNLFTSLADAQAVIPAGATVLVKSLPESENGKDITFTVAANYFTENYNTLPYTVGTAFDGSDWTANEAYNAKAVTIGNINFILKDADETDDVASAGNIGLYGFSLKLSGTAAINFNSMPDLFANFVIQNSAVSITGGNPLVSMTTYADTKPNSKGASALFKNFYVTGSTSKFFTEYVVDYFTVDGWFVPDDFADTSLGYIKPGATGGKSRVEFTNCNFQGWKANIYFQGTNGMNWFAHKSDGAIAGAAGDFEWRPVYITNNTFNNTSLWDNSAFHQIHANAISKTVIAGNRVINTGAVIPFLKNNHATYANYFSLEMYNNYVKGYKDSVDFGTSFMTGGSGVTPYGIITNNFFSDNTENNAGALYTISKTGDLGTNVTTTDWYIDPEMKLLNSAIQPYYIKSVSAQNGDAGVYNLDNTRAIVYNLKSGAADALKLTFETEGAKGTWYEDLACTKALDPATIKAGDNKTAYIKITIEGEPHSLVYKVIIFKVDNFFSATFEDKDLLTKDMLLVSNMNNDIVASYASCEPFEYTLPTDGKTYTFVKDVNAFSTLSAALAFAEAQEIVTPSVYFDYSKEGESISVSHSVKIIAPNYNVKPFDDKGFSDPQNALKITDGTGADAWTYNTAYEKNKRTVADFKFKGNISPAIEIYGVELKSYLHNGTSQWGTNFDATGRAADDAACNYVFQNILITDAVSGIFKFSTKACIEDDTALIKNVYLRSSHTGGQLSFNSEYMPETTTIDGLFADYNALGNDNKSGTRWYLKQGNSANTLIIKNSNLRNFYNENNPFLNLMGNGEYPAEGAGSCEIYFEHNILYNLGAGVNSFLFFTGNMKDISYLSFTNNYISAPTGKSLDLIRAGDTKENFSMRLKLQNNLIKGLKDFGPTNCTISTSIPVKANYRTEVSSTDNSQVGSMIVLNSKNTIASESHYLDYDMELLDTEVALTDVKFNKGSIEYDSIKNKYTGTYTDVNPGSAADFEFSLPDAAGYTWYEDSELKMPIDEADLAKVDMFYAPVYLAVYPKNSPETYILYTFDLKTESYPTNFFTDTFVDPLGVIDVNKAFIISKSFENYQDGEFIETNFADDKLYTFIKNENAFESYQDVLDYAAANNITTPHILLLDGTGISASVLYTVPAYFFTTNYDKDPYIKGTAVDGSDWESNLGDGEGQFDDKGFSVSNLSIGSLATEGEYRFYGYIITGGYKDATNRKKNVSVKIINSYFKKTSWTSSGGSGLINFGTKQTSLTAEQKGWRNEFVLDNCYIKSNNATAKALLMSGTAPSTVIFDKVFIDNAKVAATGIDNTPINCLSSYRHFEFKDSCIINYYFKASKALNNTQTGKAITTNETAEFIVDGCTFVNASLAGNGIFAADMGGLNLMKITNNKVYNESLNYPIVVNKTTTNNANIPMELIITRNYINSTTASSTVSRTLADTSVLKDNYIVTTFVKPADVTLPTYGGTTANVKKGNAEVVSCDSYFIDSELKYYMDDAIPARFVGDNTTQTATGAKYLLEEGDGVITDNGNGTYDVDVSDIVKNPAGNKVEIKIGETVKELSKMPLTVELADPSNVIVTVISYALTGSDTNEQILLLTDAVAKVSAVKVGELDAVLNGTTFSVTLPRDGENEAIAVTAVAPQTTVKVTDETTAQVTNVNVIAGESATYTITATVGDDVKEYLLVVTREEADKSAVVAELNNLIAEVEDAFFNDLDDEWLDGAADALKDALSAAYDAIDDNKNAVEVTIALAELKEAFKDAKETAGLAEEFANLLAQYKAISNADGKYCAPTFEDLQSAIVVAESSIEYATSASDVADLIEIMELAKDALATHKYVNYVHDNGTENCSSNGTKTAKCETEGCTNVKTVAETGNYKNDKHNFTNYIYNEDATMEADGTETGTCSRCGEEDTRIAEGTQLDFVDSAVQFKDVEEGKWYKDYIDYVATFGLMNGKEVDVFDPNATITRAEFVQVLANMYGIDTSNKKNDTKFTDLKDGAWYVPAVRWAAENGIVSGMTEKTFEPQTAITREQMCVMLVAYADYCGITLEQYNAKLTFKDDAKISGWAKDEVYACQMAGIVEGDGINFYPKNTAKRSEVAVIMSIFHLEYVLLAGLI